MRRLDVLVNALSELTGRDKEAVAQTFEAIIAANPDKSKDMLAELEVELIRQALEVQEGVVARAADMLGMRRTTLVEKMKKYGMSKEC